MYPQKFDYHKFKIKPKINLKGRGILDENETKKTNLTNIEMIRTATPKGIGTAKTWIPFLLYCTSTAVNSTPRKK